MRATPIPRELLTPGNLDAVVLSILYRSPILDYREGACVLRDAILDRRPWFRVIPDPPAPTKRVLCYMVAESAKSTKIQMSDDLATGIRYWCLAPTPKNTQHLQALNYWQPTALRDLLELATNSMRGYGTPPLHNTCAFDRMHTFLIDHDYRSQTYADAIVNRYRVLTALHRWVPRYSEIVEANKSG